MTRTLSDAELIAYLDEGLPPAAMAEVEQLARGDAGLLARLAEASARRDSGIHTLGDIWRRHRLSCPTREQWGSYLLGTLDTERAEFYRCHLQVVGCRGCQANLADLKRLADSQSAAAQSAEAVDAQSRRRKYFQSSAGKLPVGR